MILIDGQKSNLSLSNYTNLEEVLASIVADENMEKRIVTDVLVNEKAFSEIYPHQAEDIDVAEISKLELRTVSMEEMASDVVVELPKVIDIMASGAREVASLLRKAELAEGLEMMQDIITVSRDFLSTVQVLRARFAEGQNHDLDKLGVVLGDILSEIGDVMDNEDWILVADLLAYEYVPACEGWRVIIDKLTSEVAAGQVK